MGFGAYDEDEQPDGSTDDEEDEGEMVDRVADAEHNGEVKFETGSVDELLQQHRNDVKDVDADDGDADADE